MFKSVHSLMKGAATPPEAVPGVTSSQMTSSGCSSVGDRIRDLMSSRGFKGGTENKGRFVIIASSVSLMLNSLVEGATIEGKMGFTVEDRLLLLLGC